MVKDKSNLIIYNTVDERASVVLYVCNSSVWMNQNQLAEYFDTTKQAINYHIMSILIDNELNKNLVVKNSLTTTSDYKRYIVTFERTVC